MSSVRGTWKMECPKCHDDSHIDVTALVDIRLTPDGTDADQARDGGHEWDETSLAVCVACGFRGQVAEFALKIVTGKSIHARTL